MVEDVKINKCYTLEQLVKLGIVMTHEITFNGYRLAKDRTNSYLIWEMTEAEPTIYQVVMKQTKK